MIQYKKLMMTLALLLTAATGAWADGIVCTASDLGKVLCIDGSIYENVSAATTAGKTAAAVIVYVDETNKYGLAIALADESNYMNMSTAKSYCESKTAIKGAKWCLPSQDQWKQMFKANGGNEGSYTGLNTTITTAGGTALEGYASYWSSTEYDPGVFAYLVDLSDGDVSWYYDHEGLGRQFRACLAITDAIEVTPVAEPAANTKQWTFTQPGSNVVLTPIYAKTAAFATTGTEPDVTTLLPAAAEGVIAGTYAPLIVEGTVAKAGETENPQGTVMYAVTAATATAAPALTSSDWKTTVPTAKDIADGGAELLVWYYIQGADAPANVAATLDNTFNNSDVCATPLTVSVRSNKFDLTFNAANANTIEAGMATVTVDGQPATVTDGKLEAIKMGSEVKMTAAQGYKFRKVEVKKKARPLTDATKEGAVTRIKFNYSGNVFYADFTYSNGSFTRTGGTPGYDFSGGSWTMKEENGVLTMTANYNEMSVQCIDFVCTFYVDTNEYTAKSTGSWSYSFSGIEVNGTDITDQLTKVK